MMDTAPNNLAEHLDNFDRHLRVLKGLQPSSIARYRAHVAEFISWRAGNAHDGPLAEITRPDIEAYLEWCWRRGNANQARLTKLTGLQNFFRYLVYSGILGADPTADIPRPRADKALMHSFTREEVLRLFSAIDITREKGLRDAAAIILGAFAGLRVSEIYKFNIDHLVDDGKHLDLNIIKTKKGENRTVWIWAAPSMIIRTLLTTRLSQGAREGDPLLVSYKKDGTPRGNRRLDASSLDRLLKKLAKAAGILRPAIKMHMLRTTHANDLQQIRGYGLPQIMERMGWKDLSTAGRYLVRRERIHRIYNNPNEYWSGFNKVWTTKEGMDDHSRNAETHGDPAGA